MLKFKEVENIYKKITFFCFEVNVMTDLNLCWKYQNNKYDRIMTAREKIKRNPPFQYSVRYMIETFNFNIFSFVLL